MPAVAVTLNTNDFGDLKTLAVLAQVPSAKAVMSATAIQTTGNLISGTTYLHGVSLADFAITCGNLTGVTIWAPVQAECDLGTLANNIDQTLFLDEVYINSLEFSYTTGANATENYGGETDNKMWLLNDGAYVNYFATVSGVTSTITGGVIGLGYYDFAADGFDTATNIPNLSTGNLAFLRKTVAGAPAVSVFDASANTKTNYEVEAGATASTIFRFDENTGRLYFPTGGGAVFTVAAGDIIEMIYAADVYSDPMNSYFINKTGDNSDVGALRQGQVEISIIDGATPTAMWRLTGVTISAELTREPLTQLGNLGPYDRPLKMPIPITVKVDTTAGDLENWAKLTGKLSEFNAGTLDDIDLTDLMTKDDLILVIKVYEQTDEEAGGTGAGRQVNVANVIGNRPMVNGALEAAYGPGDVEHALKTIIVKNLKITDEGMSLDVGSNATQTFGFRANNDLYVVKGDLTPDLAAGLMRNAS